MRTKPCAARRCVETTGFNLAGRCNGCTRLDGRKGRCGGGGCSGSSSSGRGMSADAEDDADAIQYCGYLWPGVRRIKIVLQPRTPRVSELCDDRRDRDCGVNDAAIAKRSESSSLTQAANSSPAGMVTVWM